MMKKMRSSCALTLRTADSPICEEGPPSLHAKEGKCPRGMVRINNDHRAEESSSTSPSCMYLAC